MLSGVWVTIFAQSQITTKNCFLAELNPGKVWEIVELGHMLGQQLPPPRSGALGKSGVLSEH